MAHRFRDFQSENAETRAPCGALCFSALAMTTSCLFYLWFVSSIMDGRSTNLLCRQCFSHETGGQIKISTPRVVMKIRKRRELFSPDFPFGIMTADQYFLNVLSCCIFLVGRAERLWEVVFVEVCAVNQWFFLIFGVSWRLGGVFLAHQRMRQKVKFSLSYKI